MYPNFKTKPFNHQLQALGCSWDKTNYAYFMEMGTIRNTRTSTRSY